MQLIRTSWLNDFILGLISLGIVSCAAAPEKFTPTTKTEKGDRGIYTERRLDTDIFQATYEAEPSSVVVAQAFAKIRVSEMCLAANYSFLIETANEAPYHPIVPERPSIGDPGTHSHMDAPHQIATFTVRGRKTYAEGYVDCAAYAERSREILGRPATKKN